jgi:Fic family protein
MAAKSIKRRLFDRVSDMGPLLPEAQAGLADMAITLVRSAERLSGALHPITRQSVAELVRSMNSYYSNLIEGHRTMPRDIDAAVTRHFSKNPAQRSLQILHLAHMEVQCEMEDWIQKLPAADICSARFFCWLHERFYRRLPADLKHVEDEKGQFREVRPGELRDSEVSVGRHLAPGYRNLSDFLKRFGDYYGPLVSMEPNSLVAVAAAHHRLAWIHPFLDGNGRVARLFTHAWFIKAGVDSNGLWTISRGLARAQADYRATLANADEKRVNDFDGRGYLSERYLREFCQFFLGTAIDQVAFMQRLLALEGMQTRILGYARQKEFAKALPAGAGQVLREIFLRGQIPRGEVSRIVNVSPRSAQKIIGALLGRRLVATASPKGPLRLDFPSEAAAYYFPNLYPAGSE